MPDADADTDNGPKRRRIRGKQVGAGVVQAVAVGASKDADAAGKKDEPVAAVGASKDVAGKTDEPGAAVATKGAALEKAVGGPPPQPDTSSKPSMRKPLTLSSEQKVDMDMEDRTIAHLDVVVGKALTEDAGRGIAGAAAAAVPGASEEEDEEPPAKKQQKPKKEKPKKQPKQKMNVMVPFAIKCYYLEADPQAWAELPCGEVKLLRERLEFSVGRTGKQKKNDDKTGPDWEKIAKHIRD
jgi:hypothetical protein